MCTLQHQGKNKLDLLLFLGFEFILQVCCDTQKTNDWQTTIPMHAPSLTQRRSPQSIRDVQPYIRAHRQETFVARSLHLQCWTVPANESLGNVCKACVDEVVRGTFFTFGHGIGTKPSWFAIGTFTWD